MIRQYRKKLVYVWAVIFTDKTKNHLELSEFIDGQDVVVKYDGKGATLALQTPRGQMIAKVGDYIIKGVKGEYYPCKPDIFALTYEPVGGGGEDGKV